MSGRLRELYELRRQYRIQEQILGELAPAQSERLADIEGEIREFENAGRQKMLHAAYAPSIPVGPDGNTLPTSPEYNALRVGVRILIPDREQGAESLLESWGCFGDPDQVPGGDEVDDR